MNLMEFAIHMENDGEQYYLKQMELIRNASLKTVFQKLAQDEHMHGEILKNKQFATQQNDSLEQTQNVFSHLKDYKNEIKALPGQLDAYKAGLDMEQKSIDLYEKMLTEETDKSIQNLLGFLIRQEKIHYSILEELTTLLIHAEQWVEDAEFGLRKEDY